MTTKEMERKALEQIRKIVEGLGNDSYIATAFEGCIEDAEINIRDDAAYSMKARWDSAKVAKYELEAKVAEQAKQIKNLEMKAKNLEDATLAYSKDVEKHVETINGLKASSIKYWNDLQAAKAKLDEKEDEIIRLKAKLYDLMVK